MKCCIPKYLFSELIELELIDRSSESHIRIMDFLEFAKYFVFIFHKFPDLLV